MQLRTAIAWGGRGNKMVHWHSMKQSGISRKEKRDAGLGAEKQSIACQVY